MNMSDQEIKRKDAARFIDEVLLFIAKLEENQVTNAEGSRRAEQANIANRLRTIASTHGLDVPRKCEGEAHSNAYIDHCGVCMPHWGWVQKDTKVK